MHTDELLESCLKALCNGEEIPLEVTRYLARHPAQRAEIEELIFVAQRSSHLPPAELSARARKSMRERLAFRIGIDLALLDAETKGTEPSTQPEQYSPSPPYVKRIRLLAAGRAAIARLRYSNSASADVDDVAAARIRTAFRDLTPEDIRRYIGERGEDYLYYRQRFPQWELVFAALAFILRGFKRLEQLANLYS